MEQELITLGILFVFALIGGILAARFKQPMLMGLLVVGALIGPHALGILKHESIMESMIEFGAIMMLFLLGLEFNIERLKKIGLKAILIAFLNSAVLTFVGFTVSLLLGLSVVAALFMGVILAFGSTVVIVKVLENKGFLDRQEVPLLIAVLIIEDIIAVMIITFFSGVQDKEVGLIGNVESLIVSICILMLVYILFLKFIKPGLEWILKSNNSEEIMTFTALAMCAGFAYLAYALHLSPAVGAFMAGSIGASLPNSKGFEHAIAPYNIIISSFFFIAIGTLINFTSIINNIMLILVMVLVVIITKITAFSGMVYFFANMKGDKMFFSSIAMFSVGEFSLLVAKESTKFNVGIDLVSISAAIVAISAVIMALTINYSNKIYQPTVEHLPWKFRKQLDKFAEYLKAVSEELDLDTKYSRGLKKSMMRAVLIFMILLGVIFGWRKLSGYIDPSYSFAGLLIAILAIGLLMFHFIMMLKKILKLLSEIFDSATNTRSAVHSHLIVKKAFSGFGIFLIGLLFPFVMFLIDLSPYYLSVSFVLLGIAIWQFYGISRLMSDNLDLARTSFPAYKKYSYENNTKAVNRGWKF